MTSLLGRATFGPTGARGGFNTSHAETGRCWRRRCGTYNSRYGFCDVHVRNTVPAFRAKLQFFCVSRLSCMVWAASSSARGWRFRFARASRYLGSVLLREHAVVVTDHGVPASCTDAVPMHAVVPARPVVQATAVDVVPMQVVPSANFSLVPTCDVVARVTLTLSPS